MWPDFAKWEGTGNDFILVDDRDRRFPAGDGSLIVRLCHRHFGIGSDGLILLQAPREPGTAYHMAFFNPDATTSFCGNGSRCAFAFWRKLLGGAAPEQVRFTAADGVHQAALEPDGRVAISMRAAMEAEAIAPHIDLVHTGSPHLLVWVDDPEAADLPPLARELRYGPRFREAGVNVNVVAWRAGNVVMRTYERGVEDETLSCGTGVTAAAIGARLRGHTRADRVEVETRGGSLTVAWGPQGEVRLVGPVREVYGGRYHG